MEPGVLLVTVSSSCQKSLPAVQEWAWQQIGPKITPVEAQRRLDAHRQQQPDAMMGSDLLCLAQELTDAYEVHQQTRHQHLEYYKE